MRVQPIARHFAVACLAMLMCVHALPAFAARLAVNGSFQRTLKVTGAVNLDVTTGSGSVEVRRGNSNEVRVNARIHANEWFFGNAEERVRRIEQNPPIEQNGNTIHIGRISDPELRRNISISYELEVPADTELKSHTGSGNQTVDGIKGPLDVSSGSGGLKITNLGDRVRADAGSGDIDIDHVKGNVRAKSGSGSIHGSDIAGGFEADTGSGRITLEQTAPGAVNVQTGSGGMELNGVHGSLEAKAGSGTIRAQGDPSGAWTVRSGSGSIRLRLPQNAAFDLDAHTGSGSISVAHPVTVQGAVNRKEVHGKVRGGGVPVEVQTGSGTIDIE